MNYYLNSPSPLTILSAQVIHKNRDSKTKDWLIFLFVVDYFMKGMFMQRCCYFFVFYALNIYNNEYLNRELPTNNKLRVIIFFNYIPP